MIGNDVINPPAFILLERRTTLFVLVCGVRQSVEEATEGELERSWMLIQRLSKDYSKFTETQLEDLSCCLSAPVTMPTALGNY